ncbi:lipid IV(A) 3-deoxy-D-manno-octulosonic acid transferase [Candidatus Pseudomonas adelgestsugas]|nr:lipid IV(A) 3-deoxy-D-manno-octulosonic acid transferase [Candidatus Pseudomonas adelgestsugas]
MNRTLYSYLFYLALPLVLLRLWLRARKVPAYTKRVRERFAYSLPVMNHGGIWVHAVSVGEIIAAAPMIGGLIKRYPTLPITVTCMTLTGSEHIQILFAHEPRIQHCYLPYDLPCAAKRFLDHVQPELAVIMETELWPNHIHACAQRGIPVALANARMSARSVKCYARFAKLTSSMLAKINLFAVQTRTEAQYFLSLGARQETIDVTGSIKFNLTIDPQLPMRAAALREQWGASERKIWIAASTHEGEDKVILAAYRQLLENYPDALLILVPRHQERFSQILNLCRQQGFATVCRSSGEPVKARTSVLLGDTMGELLFLYALADIAFVGGSLVPAGGHNPLEPVALAIPVIMGIYSFNFFEISAMMRNAGALLEVHDAQELAEAVRQLFALPQDAHKMAEAGLKVMQANQGALKRLLDDLDELFDRYH